MHGRVKVKTDLQKAAEKKEKRTKQVQQFCAIRSEIDALVEKVKSESSESVEDELLGKTLHLCSIQPDWSIFWRHRQMVWSLKVTRETDDLIKHLTQELYLTYRVLMDHPKSYITWSHRRFTLRKMCQVSKEEGAEFIQKDIKLTEQMLSAQTEKQVEDQGRNFHCWDHRRLLLKMSDSFDLNVELGLTTRLIKSSMSNFSAWHYRSQLLMKRDEQLDVATVTLELDLIVNAVCVDPSDQSIWIYYKWIIGHATKELAETLDEHVEVLTDILSEINDLKTERNISLTLVAIYKNLGRKNEIRDLLLKLLKTDAIRSGYYQHQLNLL